MAFISQAHAQGDPRSLHSLVDKGWFWYDDPELNPPSKAPMAPQTPPIKPEDKPFTVEWINKAFPTLLNRAIQDPSPENVKNVAYLQRVMIDMSQTYSKAINQSVKTDPFLDEENRVPTAAYANVLFTQQSEKDVNEVVKYLSGVGGLWVVVDKPEKCSACATYAGVVMGLAKEHGFSFKIIQMTTPEGINAAKNLNLKITPTTIFAVPPSNYFIVSQGLLSKSDLKSRLLVAANAYKLLPKELEEKANPNDRGVLTASQLQNIGVTDDPASAITILRQRIGASGAAPTNSTISK